MLNEYSLTNYFKAEAINAIYYVQNKVYLNKFSRKTLYELGSVKFL